MRSERRAAPRPAVLAGLLLLAPAVRAAQMDEPVSFEVETSTAGACERRPVAPAWERELNDRLPEFRSMWQAVGPGMADAVRRITGKPFTPAARVTLTLCDTPSNAFSGVTVNMRYALRSFTASPVPLRYKIDTVFHEMLHAFVAQHVPRSSAALAAHASEDFCVRQHLHLLALQKAVLLATHDSDALAQVIADDSLLPSGCYRRAWQIVNEAPERWRTFVDELAQ